MTNGHILATPTCRIPKFDGRNMTADDFICKVEATMKSNKYTEKDTVEQVVYAAEGTALRWLRNIEARANEGHTESKEAMEKWEKLKVMIKERFQAEAKDTAQIQRLYEEMKMKREENPEDFMDRVEATLRLIRTQAITQEERSTESYQKLFSTDLKHHFINGLPERMREEMKKETKMETTKDVLEKAKAIFTKRTEPSNSVTEVAWINGRGRGRGFFQRGSYRGRGGSFGRGRGSFGRGATWRGRPRGRGGRPPGPDTKCYNCGGANHYAGRCQNPKVNEIYEEEEEDQGYQIIEEEQETGNE